MVTIFGILLLVLCLDVVAGLVTVKVVDGIDKLSTDSVVVTSSGAPVDSALQIQHSFPHPFEEPYFLLFLTNQCFTYSAERWEYSFCPFRNVTSKRNLGHKINVVGVWGHWQNPKEGFYRMEYVNGSVCEGGEQFKQDSVDSAPPRLMKASVTIACARSPSDIALSYSTKIISVDDGQHCFIEMVLSVPIACSLLAKEQ